MSAGTDEPSTGKRTAWAVRYARRLLLTDAIVIVSVVIASQYYWFGLDFGEDFVTLPQNSQLRGIAVTYSVVSVFLAGSWLAVLAIYGTRSPRVIGIGSFEYKRIVDASLRLFGLLAIGAFVLKVDLARGYVLTAFPIGLLLLIGARWGWRQWLVRQRRAGRYSARTLVVGSADGIAHITDQFTRRFPYAGYKVIGACLTRGGTARAAGVPVLGRLSDLMKIVAEHRIEVVLITSSDDLTPDIIRTISWELEDTNVDMAVSPSLLEVVGPRIHTRSVAGMPLIHVDVPRYEGSKALAKVIFDKVFGLIALVILSVPMIVLAILTKATSPGPVLFRQERVGLGGKTFHMLKFRSMIVDAEDHLAALQQHNESDGGILFKIKDDPRVTPLGRIMRKYSLDELPQFFNVLAGDMSLVGPRPPLPSEVEKFDSHVLRRFLVKPGLTGPWQVSGRAELSWEDGVRLDLYYVENWSLTGDVIYLWRTLKVMAGAKGGY